MNQQTITLIGIAATLAISIVNLIFTIRNAKKTSFLNSVTASRIKYIQDIRTSISRFCGLAHTYNLSIGGSPSAANSDLHKEVDNLRYLIRLYLNPEDEGWDRRIMGLCDDVIRHSDGQISDLTKAIDDLVAITQYLLKLEWEGIKREAESGILSQKSKQELKDTYLRAYENRSRA
jgi:hypothetical protein